MAKYPRLVYEMVADPVRPRLYATTGANTVLVINTVSLAIVAEVTIGSDPRGLALSADNRLLYVANSGSTVAGIGILDLETLTTRPALSTAYAPRQIAVGLENRLYVVAGELRQLDATTGEVQNTFSGGQNDADVYGGVLRITPDRRTLFYGNTGLSPATLFAFNVSGTTPVLRETSAFNSLGSNGEDLAIKPDGTAVCYMVGSGNRNYDIAEIPVNNLAGRRGTFATGAYPATGAYSPDGLTFYSAPSSQEKLLAFNTTSYQAKFSFPITSYFPTRIVADQSGSVVFVADFDDVFDESNNYLYAYRVGGPRPPVITSEATTTWQKGVVGSFTAEADQAVTWSSSALPAGLTLNKTTGVISGKPTVPKVSKISLTATTAAGGTVTLALTMDVQTHVQITTSGDGTVDGPAADEWFSVGTPITVTALPDPDGGFKAWSGASTSAEPVLQIKVTANMVLQANFDFVVPITVVVDGDGTVTPAGSPLRRKEGSQLVLTATAAAGAHFENWSGAATSAATELSLVVGRQPLAFTANFGAGERSALTISLEGPGSLAVGSLGTSYHLEEEVITVQAAPQAGARFLGWSGLSTAKEPQVSFHLTQSGSLQANFEVLAPYAGTYLLLDEQAASLAARTNLKVTLGAGGVFSAVLKYGTHKFTFTGDFQNASGWEGDFLMPGADPVHLKLELPVATGTPRICATLGNGPAGHAMSGVRPAHFSALHPSPYRGTYSLLLPPAEAVPKVAWGYARAVVSASGLVTLTGRLGDGTSFTAGSSLGEGDRLRAEATLPPGRGFLAGSLTFSPGGTGSLQGNLGWVRPAKPAAPLFAVGIQVVQPIAGSRLPDNTSGRNLLTYRDGQVELTGEVLPPDLISLVQLGVGNTVQAVTPDANHLRATINARTGVFSGSFLPPGAKASARRPFSGMVEPGQQVAVGQYSSGAGPGSVVLGVRPQ